MPDTTQPDTQIDGAPEPRRLKPGVKRISLALQGGGSHGAFTWGVMHRLMSDPRIYIDGISGTSAGAMNAVVFADGFLERPAPGRDRRARALLDPDRRPRPCMPRSVMRGMTG